MVKSTDSKRVWKWIWPLLFISVPCGVTALVLVHVFLDTLPEKDLAKDFLRENPRAIAFFGEVLSVSRGNAGSRVTSQLDGRREGHYCFWVEGTKRSGEVFVYWTSKGSGSDFKVNKVEFYQRGKGHITIWPDANDP
jgi:hypothetical protein